MDKKLADRIRDLYRASGSRLILLDYDGTLVNLTPLPDTAHLPAPMSELIRRLEGVKGNHVYIITGRGYEDIERFVDHMPVKIISDHGAMIKENGQWHELGKHSSEWMEPAEALMVKAVSRCRGSFIEKKTFSLAWHFRNTEQEEGLYQKNRLVDSLAPLLDSYNLKLIDGNKVIELIGNTDGKGKAVDLLLKKHACNMILAIGDDTTDEDMFEHLAGNPYAVTLKVGDGKTLAQYKLHNVDAVYELLKHISA